MKEILNLILVFFFSTYWLIVPVVFLSLVFFLWEKSKSKRSRWMITAASLLGVVLMVWYGFGRVAYYDWQVKKMCAEDGGVTVYETVELTPELLDWAGRIRVPDKSKAKPSDKYYMQRKITYYHKNNPQVTRWHSQIIRRSDGKVLGEYIRYGRGGGDLPGLWHGSNFSCSDITGFPKFESLIFIKGDKQ